MKLPEAVESLSCNDGYALVYHSCNRLAEHWHKVAVENNEGGPGTAPIRGRKYGGCQGTAYPSIAARSISGWYPEREHSDGENVVLCQHQYS